MSIPCNTLPAEIWLLIFNHVEDVKQLATCRVVCKAWDPLAERAMFGQALYFKDVNTATEFYNHLVKKPFLGQCIKDVALKQQEIVMDTVLLRKEFFHLAFTSDIRDVQNIVSGESLQIMLDIAQGATKHLTKIASYLPLHVTFDERTQKEIALYFCKTWKSFSGYFINTSISPHLRLTTRLMPLVSRLDELESSTSLIIIRFKDVNSLAIVEDILEKCHHLPKLDIRAFGDHCENTWLDPKEWNEWMIRHVRKCAHVCELSISILEGPQIAEYLLYKYPTANRVQLKLKNFTENPRGTFRRCMHAVKNVDTVSVVAWIVKDQKLLLQDIVVAMKSEHSNRLTLRSTNFRMDAIALVQAQRYKSRGHTQFRITISKDQQASLTEEIKSLIGVEAHEVD